MSSNNINKFENWLPFQQKENDKTSNDIIMKYHLEWVKKYPELKMLSLESDYYKNTWSWLYSLNKKNDSINIDLFIEIVKKGDNWNISLELVLECEDEYLTNNKKDKSNTQDEKHYEKHDLDWEELNLHMKKISEWIRMWNQEFHKEWGFFPLVD